MRKKTSPLEKYIFLHTIQDSDETLFYAILMRHTTETMPFVYTPTVGEACQKWSRIFRHAPRGLYLSINDKGHIRRILDHYPNKDIKVIVVTDGERILGLGDLGVNGMGIPIGKLALYTACAGIDPAQCLPVHLDVGTDRSELLTDPAYMGLRQRRVRGEAYDALVREFFEACQDAYGRNVLIQFEDFGNTNAFRLLEQHQHSACCFNDDIQGTASVVLAGVKSTLGLTKKSRLSEHTFLFCGAGEAGVGIANLISSAVAKEDGCSEQDARRRIWLFDSAGLVHAGRSDADKLAHHKLPYAHALPKGASGGEAGVAGVLKAIKQLRPSALVGVSAQGGCFNEAICREMAALNSAPLILALSNPTSKAECTAEQAYGWTEGRCVFFSGSPFDPVVLPDGRRFVPGQGNNAYIFPGVGLGAVAVGALSLTDEDFAVAASTLAALVSDERLAQGCAYPPIKDIREVSLAIAAAVAESVLKSGRGTDASLSGASREVLARHCRELMYNPTY